MNVVFAAAEAVPFAKTGGLADVAGALPQALVEEGCKVIVFLPFYRQTEESGFDFERINDHLLRTAHNGVQYYFIDHDHFFDRDGLYGDAEGDFEDNFDRFHYFCEQILENLIEPDMTVDVIHCHDWHTALIPVLLKAKYRDEECFRKTKTVLTIHNLAFQGIFPKERFSKLNIDDDFLTDNGLLFYNQVSFLKGGICFSDQVTTVSTQYAKEIQTKEFGCGLEKEIHGLKNEIVGIQNGIDEEVWNPETDPLISASFNKDDWEKGKSANKKCLQKQFKLEAADKKVILGFVGRVSEQKGVTTIMEAFKATKKLPVQFVLQGIGDKSLGKKLAGLMKRCPERFVYFSKFDESIAHRIYAGSDFFLMPSMFEPCGLSQMIAMRYGTLPIVAPIGGLVDTVKHGENGLVTEDLTTEALVQSIEEAVAIFQKPQRFLNMREQAFQTHFDWSNSAQEYRKLYACL